MTAKHRLHSLLDKESPDPTTRGSKISHFHSEGLPLKICRFSNGSHQTHGVHYEHHQLILPLRSNGVLELEIDSERATIETKKCPLTFAPAGAMQSYSFTGSTDNLVISLDAAYVSGLAENWGTKGVAEKLEPKANLGNPKVSYLMRQMLRHFQKQNEGSHLSSEAIAIQLTVELFWYFSGGPGQAKTSSETSVSVLEVTDFIKHNLETHLSLSDLANLSGLDVFSFSRAFKSQTGRSPRQYIIRCRVDRACELLENPKLSLAEIAYACGFSSQSHMTTTFGSQIGVTPGRYRENLLL